MLLVWCSAADIHLKLLERVVSGAPVEPVFYLGVCLSVTLHIIDLWQYYVSCIRSDVTRCTPFLGLYLYVRMRITLWSHICIFMCLLVEEPRSTSGHLFSSQCLCGMILLTIYSMVWVWQISRAERKLFYWPKLLSPFLFSTVLHFTPSLL